MKRDICNICLFTAVSALVCAGCLSVKTEHEIKPIEIHATVDLNLKVDRQLDEAVGQSGASERFKAIKALLESGKIGLDSKSMMVPRAAITSDEMETVAAANAKFKERLAKIVSENGANPAEVAARGREKMIAGDFFPKGAWYQEQGGEWRQK